MQAQAAMAQAADERAAHASETSAAAPSVLSSVAGSLAELRLRASDDLWVETLKAAAQDDRTRWVIFAFNAGMAQTDLRPQVSRHAEVNI